MSSKVSGANSETTSGGTCRTLRVLASKTYPQALSLAGFHTSGNPLQFQRLSEHDDHVDQRAALRAMAKSRDECTRDIQHIDRQLCQRHQVLIAGTKII